MQNLGDTTYQRMKRELLNSGDRWRFVETLASKAGTPYEKAVQLLYEDPGIVFSVNRDSQRLLVKLATPHSTHAPSGITFDRKSISISGASIPYLVHRPPGYSPDSMWPVVLFLHGAGERGNDGVRQMRAGLGPTLRCRPDLYPALVVLPQLPFGPGWEHQVNDVNTDDLILKALDQTIQEYNGDSSRQYLTGISMGAFGCWIMASQHPNRFAAMLSICGGVYGADDPIARVRNLITLPVWAFHGQADPAVKVFCSRRAVDAARAVGSMGIRYTEIDSDAVSSGEFRRNDHEIWDEVYSRNDVAEWLFAQRHEL
jgi:predicted peptidase